MFLRDVWFVLLFIVFVFSLFCTGVMIFLKIVYAVGTWFFLNIVFLTSIDTVNIPKNYVITKEINTICSFSPKWKYSPFHTEYYDYTIRTTKADVFVPCISEEKFKSIDLVLTKVMSSHVSNMMYLQNNVYDATAMTIVILIMVGTFLVCARLFKKK